MYLPPFWPCIPHLWHLFLGLCKFLPFSCLGLLCLHFWWYDVLPFKDYLLSFFIYFFHIYCWFFLVSWTNISFTLGNDFEPVGWDWWFFIKSLLFCSTTRRHDINFEYLLKLHSLYCCYKTIFKARKEENIFSNIWFIWYFYHKILTVR
jgi:hypothetical protein